MPAWEGLMSEQQHELRADAVGRHPWLPGTPPAWSSALPATSANSGSFLAGMVTFAQRLTAPAAASLAATLQARAGNRAVAALMQQAASGLPAVQRAYIDVSGDT